MIFFGLHGQIRDSPSWPKIAIFWIVSFFSMQNEKLTLHVDENMLLVILKIDSSIDVHKKLLSLESARLDGTRSCC